MQGLTRRLDVKDVFYDVHSGKPFGDIKKSFKTALKHAKITDFHFHDLRHTFASQMIMAGVDITTVSRLLGHKSLKITLKYSHMSPEHNAAAVRKMDTFFSENEGSIRTKLAQSGDTV